MQKPMLIFLFCLLLISLSNSISTELFLNYDGSCDVHYYDIPPALSVELPEDAVDVFMENSSSDYSLSFRTQSLTRKQGLLWSVDYVSPFDAELTVILPAGARLTQGIGEVSTKNGLIYLQKEILSGEALDVEYSLYAEKDEFPFSYILLVLLFAVIFLIYYFYSRKPYLKLEQRVSADEKKLEFFPETEKKIIKFLLSNNGVTQKKLEAGTSLPKSTLSRVLSSLEVKGFVERKKVGLSKKIFLSQSFIEQIKKEST
ncbi:hypothetical protein KAW38_02570 [Candidatus Micrarchaeota archaeon]|nr:hypothetical protein [Candidatus Micrarchaeota archaeon]